MGRTPRFSPLTSYFLPLNYDYRHHTFRRGGTRHPLHCHRDLIPLGQADLVISLEPMEVLRYLPYLKKDGRLITNSTPFVNIDNYPDPQDVIAAIQATGHAVVLDVDTLAKEAGSTRAANMVLLGAASPFLGLEVSKMEEGVRQVFLRKGEAVADMNVKAFRAGLEQGMANLAYGMPG